MAKDKIEIELVKMLQRYNKWQRGGERLGDVIDPTLDKIMEIVEESNE